MEKEIRKIMEEFNGLIDEETARMLLMERMGKREGNKIGKLKEGKTWLYAAVENIVMEEDPFLAVIGDETGHCILKIWGNTPQLREGDVIKIVNGWAKRGRRGMEVNIGKYGMVEKAERNIVPKFEFGMKEGLFNLKGEIEKIFPTQVYLGKKETFVRKILLGNQDIYLINEMAKEMERFGEKEYLFLLWLHERNGRIYGDELSKALKRDEFYEMIERMQ